MSVRSILRAACLAAPVLTIGAVSHPAEAALTIDGGRCPTVKVAIRSLIAGGWRPMLFGPGFAVFMDPGAEGYSATVAGRPGERRCAEVTPPFGHVGRDGSGAKERERR